MKRRNRVHRLGQQRPVHVFHFVASGTSEQGMLDLLKFKTSLFAGVLDGGQDEVYMGGTRLKRFMELEGLVAARAAKLRMEHSASFAPRARLFEPIIDGPARRRNCLATFGRSGANEFDRRDECHR
jgi:hypothetical protein